MTQAKQIFDVCVVGSGAAGGVVAMQLAQAGANVVVLEAGKWVDPTTEFFSHTMPYELPKNGYGWSPHKHLRVDPKLEPFTQAGNRSVDHFLTKKVGGKSLLWAGLSWRNSKYDFASWPISYDELAPYYDKMEVLMGVTGNYDNHPNVPDGKYLKPLKWNCTAFEIQKGANKLDAKKYKMITARKAILTEKNWSKRAPCHYCSHCMRGCDTESKYTSANTAMPLAIATGKCKLILYANVAEVLMSQDGSKTVGVRYFDARTKKSYEVFAKNVVLACGPVESARLMLLSKSKHFPTGVANSSGQIGKNLISHTSTSAQGFLKSLKQREIYNDDGTDSSHAYIPAFYWEKPHKDFRKGYHIIVDGSTRHGTYGGGMFKSANGFGAELKKEIRDRYPALINLYSQNGMDADASRFVELDPKVKDVYGLAVPKINFSLTAEDIASSNDSLNTISQIIEASGGVITGKSNPNSPGVDSVHYCGTAKMGNDPKASVLNPYLQAHDVKNLFVADGSGFIDFSEKNPTLTVMALASRSSDYLIEKLKRG